MAWGSYYQGDGSIHAADLKPPPPWREFPRKSLGLKFRPPKGLPDAVNAALSLRRPLLITGKPGSGKSTVIESVAHELALGPVLRWHITSRSTLGDALYRYDALGRIHEQQLKEGRKSVRRPPPSRARRAPTAPGDIAPFLRLGPLGTALLPASRPRALLIDEIDKSDLDLPSDLLDVLERGEYEIPELARYGRADVAIRHADSEETAEIHLGRVQCTEFPFIVMTSNEERDFPAPFLRRCIRFAMPVPGEEEIRDIVSAHLDMEVSTAGPIADLITGFVARLQKGDSLAIDQLLGAVFVLGREDAPESERRKELTDLLLRGLTSRG